MCNPSSFLERINDGDNYKRYKRTKINSRKHEGRRSNKR